MNDLDTHSNLAAVVRAHAATDPARRAFTCLAFPARSAQAEQSHLTIGEIDQRARAIAARLQRHAQRGDRVMLLFRPGLEFVSALLGCFYAGVVTVPCPVPRLGVGAARLQRIAADAGVTLALSTDAVHAGLADTAPALEWVLVDKVADSEAAAWRDPGVEGADLAVLQYSSGSTGQPKGVMLSHANLMDQLALIAATYECAVGSTVVSWLPAFHDMGLVFGILQPLYRAQHSVLMAPEAFIQRPSRWLRAIADFRAVCSVAPDFAFELCTRAIPDEELAGIDLSCWQHAGNAAEPVRSGTIERFAARHAQLGFRRAAFAPMYGLAEATLMVACGAELRICDFDADALERNEVVPARGAGARRLVSCGTIVAGADVRIVDPENLAERGADCVGEILVAGGSVGQGYFGDAVATEATFVRSEAFGARTFVRTGDLGFFHDGELYVCGRLKDLILIRGANHHAPDIEATVEASHPALKPSGGAAFPVEVDEQEKLVVVYELERGAAGLATEELAAVASSIRQRVAEAHRIAVHAILLVQRGVPKTSSGKVQRLATRARYLAGAFNAKYLWQADAAAAVAVEEEETAGHAVAAVPAALAERIGTWLPAAYADLLGCGTDDARVTQPFTVAGPGADVLDQLRRRAEIEFSILLDPLVFQEIDSIAALARHIGILKSKGVSSLGLPLEQLDFQAESRDGAVGEPIAIVGIGCRFPGANGPAQFWDNLRQGVDSVTEVPAERWEIDTVYDSNPLAIAKMNTRSGGFLKDIDQFDRQFFDCSVREAVRMDPSHRLMAELSWEALEDAGIAPEAMGESRTGVFVGISGSDYAHLQFADESMADAYAGLGSALTNAASRISHFLNLRGPAMAIDTACSSSLSALHLALTSMRAGECEMALVGGVNIILSPSVTMSLCKAGMMAPDGRCKAFDSRANGYVRAEGAGLVLLKPLSRALADGDQVYAVIRGSASNHDGRSSALAAPNGEAQQRVVMAACNNAGVLPGQLDYVEAHGTGTPVGDPIEVNALGEVLRIGAAPDTHCAIGSVKTNIGHTESAAGVASIIKAALMLKHRTLVPSLHFVEPNPKIPFDRLRVKVQTELRDLSDLSAPALVGVNGFGIGGTNVHVVLEEYREDAPQAEPAAVPEGQLYTLPLSAKTANALKANAQAMADYLRDAPVEVTLADVCEGQVRHRAQFDQRLAAIGATRQELAARLDAYASVNQSAEVVSGAVRPAADGTHKLAFVFSGHGSQWWAMGRQLYAAEPVYRAALDRCDAVLQAHTGWSIVELVHRENGDTLLDDTGYAQPAIFALQVGLLALWDAWGIRPDAIVGHSVGEIAASHAAGILSLDDAARLVAIRANLMRSAPSGGMVSVDLSPDDLALRLQPYGDALSLGAINGPRACVVSGDADALQRLQDELAAENIGALRLPINYAFHSASMEPFKHRLVAALAGISPRPAAIPFASSVSGEWLGEDELLDAAYWGGNLREKVSLKPAIETVARSGITTFLEIGPHPIFAGNIVKTLNSMGLSASVHASLNRREAEPLSMRNGFATLWSVGKSGNWSALQPAGRFHRSQPAYRWDRQRYWLDNAHAKALRRLSDYPLLTTRLPLAQPAWESQLDHQSVPYLDAQRVQGHGRFPNGVAIEMALEAAYEQMGETAHELADVAFGEPLRVESGSPLQTLQTLIRDETGGNHALCIMAESARAAEGGWRTLVQANVRGADQVFKSGAPLDLEMLKRRAARQLDASLVYQTFSDLGVRYETPLQLVAQVWLSDEEALVELAPRDPAEDAIAFRLPPPVFEGIEQALRIGVGIGAARHVLAGIDRLRVLGPTAQARHVFVRRRAGATDGHSVSDAWLVDAEGSVLAVAEGLQLVAQQRDALDDFRIPADPVQWRYQYHWEAQPVGAGAPAALGGRWLLLADQGGVAGALAERLRANGAEVMVAYAGTGFAQVSAQDYTVRPDDLGDLAQLIASVTANGAQACKAVLHMWGMDAAGVDAIVDPQHDLDQTQTAISLAMVVQALTKAGLGSRPRLWVVSAGAQPAGSPAAVEVTQAPMWGLGKGIALEHAELRCCRVDLSGQVDPVEIDALLKELHADGQDDQVALRMTERYVARLQPQIAVEGSADHLLPVARAKAEGTPFDLGLVRGDSGAAVTLHAAERSAPGEDQIEIRVSSAVVPAGAVQAYRRAGSRARHPLQANLHAGRVVRVGPGVTRFHVGDEVAVLQNGPVRSHVVSATDSVLPLAALDAAVAGSVKPYLAASLAMNTLAAVNRSTCVFVNGADGVLGQAVAQVARALGVRVYLSVTDPAALEWIARLDPIHAFDLSDPSHIDQLRALRGDKGVDVFVNCVPGYDLARCAPALSPFGRCIDMAACDGAAAGVASRLRLPGNASLQSLDVDGLARHDADLLATLLEDIGARLADGSYHPVQQREVDLDTLADALHDGSSAQLAVALPQPALPGLDEAASPFRADATYLVTGGLGGLGLALARRMAQRGARHLVLAGRSAPSLAALDAVADIELLGARCLTISLDVADPAQVAQALDSIDAELPPLRGIVHAAGTLDNGLLIQLDKAQFQSVARAKVQGAWNLHRQLGDRPLDFFVLFSSLASAIGSPGQSNYSAANAFLDALAEHRKAQGLAGLSVGWGPWSEVGMAADVHTLDKLAEHGMGMVPLAAGLTLLEELVAEGRQGAMAVLPMHWARWGETFPLAGALPYFGDLVPRSAHGATQSHVRITADMLGQMGEEAQIEVLQSTVLRAVAQAMRIDADTLDVNTPLTAAGLDSILALELKSRIEAGIDVVVQTYALLKGQTVRGLALQFRNLMLTAPTPAAAPAATAPVPAAPAADDAAALLDRIGELSEAEVASLLLELEQDDVA